MRCQNLLMLLMLEEQQAPWTERLQEKNKKQWHDGGGCPRPNSLALIMFLCWRWGGLGWAGAGGTVGGGQGEVAGSGRPHPLCVWGMRLFPRQRGGEESKREKQHAPGSLNI